MKKEIRLITKCLMISTILFSLSGCTLKDSLLNKWGKGAKKSVAISQGADTGHGIQEFYVQGRAGDASGENQQLVYFAFDSYEVPKESQEKLNKMAAFLHQNPEKRVRISGHADERGSAEYNITLGWKRSLIVAEYLQKKGVQAKQVVMLSYGKEKPAESGHNEKSWYRNRRAELELL